MTVLLATIHASVVLVDARAVLIRGPSGAGKSRLALALLEAAEIGLLAFARLVADDRVHVEAVNGRLLARPPASLAGLAETYGLGIVRLPFEPMAVVGLVVDLAADDAARMLPSAACTTVIEGITLPRIAVPAGDDPMRLTVAALRSSGLFRTAGRVPNWAVGEK